MKLLFLSLFCFSLFASEDIRIMGVGYCTVDLLVQVEDSFVEQHIVSKKGECQREEAFEPIDFVLGKIREKPKIAPGGSAANTVRALAQLGQPCAFWGHVGEDSWGESFVADLLRYRIDPRLKKAPFTSRVLCLISPDGQRTFLSCDPEVEEMPVQSDFQDIRWMHFEARQMFNRTVFEEMIAFAREFGIRISLDLSCTSTVKCFKQELLDLIKSDVEVLFCNESEAEALLGLRPEEACLELQKRCPVAVVTIGEKGCLVGHHKTVTAVEACPANVVDTTGAGDYFSAGFLYGYFRDLPLEKCARMGHRLAKEVVQVIGTELSDETWDSLRSQIIPHNRKKLSQIE